MLSACETGLGQLVRGEGVIGLTRGFLYAAPSSVLVSLWRAADATTATLMVDFYRELLTGQAREPRPPGGQARRDSPRPGVGQALLLVGLGLVGEDVDGAVESP